MGKTLHQAVLRGRRQPPEKSQAPTPWTSVSSPASDGKNVKVLIVHAHWLNDRKRTLARLLEQVPGATVLSSRRPEHANIWARRAWEWAEDQDCPVAILNDDVTVCPDFEATVAAMTDAAPGRVLSLHTSVPEATRISGRWLRCYWLTGPGYVLPRGAPSQLLGYWAGLPWDFASKHNEDVIAIHWAWQKQEPFWSSIPAVVKHDTSTRSSLGYDNHPMRTSCVPWDQSHNARLTDPEYWRHGAQDPPFVENPWSKNDYLASVRRELGR